MEKNRLEAFSDGVIAIILTIMVLDLKVPKAGTWDALAVQWPIYVAYALSYTNVFLVWLTHHTIFSAVKHVDIRLLWINGSLLFVASLIPFATAYAGESHWTEPLPVALYGWIMAGVSYIFIKLRTAASAHIEGEIGHAVLAAGLRVSRLLMVGFLVGSLVAWNRPKAALWIYTLVPLLRMWRGRNHQPAATGRHPGESESKP